MTQEELDEMIRLIREQHYRDLDSLEYFLRSSIEVTPV